MLVLLHSWSQQFYMGTREQEAHRDVCGSLGTHRDHRAPHGVTRWSEALLQGHRGPWLCRVLCGLRGTKRPPSTTWTYHVGRSKCTRGGIKGQGALLWYTLVSAAHYHHHYPWGPFKEASK